MATVTKRIVAKTVDEYIGAFTSKLLGQIGLGGGKGWREEEFE